MAYIQLGFLFSVDTYYRIGARQAVRGVLWVPASSLYSSVAQPTAGRNFLQLIQSLIEIYPVVQRTESGHVSTYFLYTTINFT
jgi:hypothetical protein